MFHSFAELNCTHSSVVLLTTAQAPAASPPNHTQRRGGAVDCSGSQRCKSAAGCTSRTRRASANRSRRICRAARKAAENAYTTPLTCGFATRVLFSAQARLLVIHVRARDTRPPSRRPVTSASTAASCGRVLELRGEWRRARQRQLAVLAILLFCYSAIPPASGTYSASLAAVPPALWHGAHTMRHRHTRNTHHNTHTKRECRARQRQALPWLRCGAHWVFSRCDG